MGCDKLLVTVNGVPVVENIIRVCQECVDTVIISANSNSKFEQYGLRILPDEPNYPGPLGGIIACLKDCAQSDELCLIVAADLIDVDQALIQMLIQQYTDEDFLGVLEGTTIQPLCGIYHVRSLPPLISSSHIENFKVRNIVGKLQIQGIPPTSEKWRNLNTPDDLESVRGDHA